MFSQTTRFELLIVAVALLVLVFCSRPPQSGNAQTGPEAEAPSKGPQIVTPSSLREDLAPVDPPQSTEGTPLSVPPVPVQIAAPANPVPVRSEASVQPSETGRKRMAIVDARKAKGLNYPDVMVGEITVQWVWDGTKLVAQKVCKVTESNGVVSTWSFDGRDGVIITPVE